MFLIRRIEFIRHAPFIARKCRTWLERSQNLLIHANAIRSMTGGLDGVCSIKGLILKWAMHEITLYELDSFCQALLSADLVTSRHLVRVQSQAFDLHLLLEEFGNVACRSTDTASYIHNLGSRLERAEHTGEVILMATRALGKGLPLILVRKVEGLTPAPLVELRGEIVVGVHKLLVFGVAIIHGPGVQCVVVIDSLVDVVVASQLVLLLPKLLEERQTPADRTCRSTL
mmetsp:Transcript_16702/g.26065  ORF Transcript_16702/g.26065 Transcript_16702/m.26065 type:complete len:229 (-) Transcript_16702:83-769(-)